MSPFTSIVAPPPTPSMPSTPLGYPIASSLVASPLSLVHSLIFRPRPHPSRKGRALIRGHEGDPCLGSEGQALPIRQEPPSLVAGRRPKRKKGNKKKR